MSSKTMDIEKLRKETKGCSTITHFNNAGSSLIPDVVLKTVTDYLNEESTYGAYEAYDRNQEGFGNIYKSIGKLINASPSEVAIIENATRSWDMAFYSIPFKKGDVILTSVSEYASNYIAFLQMSKKIGVDIRVIPNDEHGQVSIESLKDLIDDKVKLIAITHIPTNGGLVNPVEEIGKVASENNILFLLDACQSVGHVPIDVKKIKCDFLSATSRKYLRGPRGVGFLYVKENLISTLEPVFLDLHSAEWINEKEFKIVETAKRFENWEAYYAGRLGLGAAIDYALDLGIENIWKRIQHLSNYLREGLSEVKGAKICDLGEVKCGIVSFYIYGIDSNELKARLREKKVNISVSPPQYTLTDMKARNLPALARASVHYYNTEDEVKRLISSLDA